MSLARELVVWLAERPLWMQEAAQRLRQNGKLSPADISALAECCKKGDAATQKPKLEAGVVPEAIAVAPIKLLSISEPRGIDALDSQTPLAFSENKLCIVYGENGTGKSGYIRILKKLCGSRVARDLIGNVFDSKKTGQSCKIAYSINGEKKEITWDPAQGQNKELSSIEIYDTDSGSVYTKKENEVLFEPPLLGFLQRLIEAAGEAEQILAAEIRALSLSLPELPGQYTGTGSGKWYSALSFKTPDAEIDVHCTWKPEDQANLDGLAKRLAEPNPKEEATKLRRQKDLASALANDLEKIRIGLEADVVQQIEEALKNTKEKRKTASEDAQKVFAQAPLEGVGTESWKALWDAAREYSTAHAYKEHPFPHVDTDAKCVLCQQDLDKAAQARLVSFESFVTGSLEREANAASNALKALVAALPEIDAENVFASRLEALPLQEDQVTALKAWHQAVQSRKAAIKDVQPLPDLPTEELITKLHGIAASLEEKAKKFDEDAKASNKDTLQKESNELNARKWVSEQRKAVIAGRERQQKIQNLESAKKLLNTKSLSDKKSQLTKQLITDDFILRFEKELKWLDADYIKVELIKAGTTKGIVTHQVRLRNAQANAKAGEILSEGEQRIVSIAAFLADNEISSSGAPFVFDDPISSLDISFEEAAAKRLVALSRERQVIIFTHRVSLLASLEEASEGVVETEIVSVRRWGEKTGLPSDAPIHTMRPKEILNKMLNEHISKAKKLYTAGDQDVYTLTVKNLCCEIRDTIERLIEETLLGKIIIRFRRSVQTQHIGDLSKITKEDCKLIDEFMTEYSKFKHSQPKEAPITLPSIEKIEADLKRLLAWHSDFTKRAA